MALAGSSTGKLAAVFDLPASVNDAAGLVRTFDFNSQTVSSEESINVGLAPAFGNLNAETIKDMDENLKIIITATTRMIGDLKDKSWTNVVSALMQNNVLEPLGGEIQRSDTLIKDGGLSVFKFDGSPEESTVREVEAWFRTLISDDDVIDSSGIDISVLGRVVAATGARVDSLKAVVSKSVYLERKLLEIGVLRYPDIENPFFKVYRIKLTAWSNSDRTFMVQTDKNGIAGEFSVRKFKPRDNVIKELSRHIASKAVKEAEAYLA